MVRAIATKPKGRGAGAASRRPPSRDLVRLNAISSSQRFIGPGVISYFQCWRHTKRRGCALIRKVQKMQHCKKLKNDINRYTNNTIEHRMIGHDRTLSSCHRHASGVIYDGPPALTGS